MGGANDYFSNSVLTKEYEMRCKPIEFDGPEIYKCKGCDIDWKQGKNLTVKTVTRKQKHKQKGSVRTIKKTVKNDSLFNFFSPPDIRRTRRSWMRRLRSCSRLTSKSVTTSERGFSPEPYYSSPVKLWKTMITMTRKKKRMKMTMMKMVRRKRRRTPTSTPKRPKSSKSANNSRKTTKKRPKPQKQ